MRSHTALRRAITAALLLVAFLFQGTWALAGVTGNLAGVVRDSKGAPVAGATVEATSPSQTAKTTTDAQGHFIFLALAPDTYTINVSKTGYQSTSFPGNVVFADQTQQTVLTMVTSLKTIAHVTSQAASSLVKSGVGGDLYSVNSAQAAASAPLGGGGNLNNAYSAMAAVPGVQVGIGGMGWDFNAAYIRGQNSYYTGYEYDGIPVNRAFDNYNSSTESSLGLQELQVYTGGGPASISTSGTAGFINQVIKTGTYPGYAQGTLGIATNAFYHSAQIEFGGSTPDRNFSYYVGLSGNNQAFRLLSDSNLANLMVPNGIYSGPSFLGYGIGYSACRTFTCQGVKSTCTLGTAPGSTSLPQGCWAYYSGIASYPSLVSDRENVVNVHIGIPKHNGLRDDIQLLWSGSALNNYAYDTPNDIGPGNQFFWSLYGAPFGAPTCNQQLNVAPGLTVTGCADNGGNCTVTKKGAALNCYTPYADGVAYNLPFGSVVATSAGSIKAPSAYYAPATPPHQFDQAIPLNDNSLSVNSNDTGIAKLQYTYALSPAAYLRAFGYSFYSDWLEVGPLYGATGGAVPSLTAAQYDLMTHTYGGALDFSDQINDQNLLSANGNYTEASVIRFNNSSAYGVDSPIGYMGGGKCYDPSKGFAEPCLSSTYYQVGTGPLGSNGFVHPTWVSNATTGPTGFAKPGATWDSIWNGNVTGALNTVKPKFMNASISDEFRPNDKLLFDAALRYDNFTYGLPNEANAAANFYASMTANYTCVLAQNNEVLTAPLPPGVPPPASALYVNGDCNAAVASLFPTAPHTGWVHPNGTTQDGVKAPSFTATTPGSYSLNYWEPRFAMTYTESPNTVWRLSAGRFTQPPISASVQYYSASGDNRSLWNNMMNLGFYSPFHPIPGVSSAQYDASYERHIPNTDWSFKLTPYYTWVNQWQQQTFIGAGFVTQVPVGVNRNYGVEFQLNKGDFSRNGLSGAFNFTYTNSKVQFQNETLSTGGVIPNTTIALNEVISQYNALTKAGGGFPCYTPASYASSTGPVPGKGVTTCSAHDILNPYYNQPMQGLLDPNGWYNPYSTAIAPNLYGGSNSYISPITSTLILNYRMNKFAITPSFQFQAGGFYGSPLDITGVDPRACSANSRDSGILKLSPGTNPLQCNYLSMVAPGFGQFGYFYIPDPQTGHFSAMGSYENPNMIVGNLQLSYDVNPRIKLILTGTNIFHACFGGYSEPWTAANPPSPTICGYGAAGSPLNTTVYPANFYNGKGIGDVKANGGVVQPFTQSYMPGTSNLASIGASLPPFNLYINAQIRI
jgi:hypothetical protein